MTKVRWISLLALACSLLQPALAYGEVGPPAKAEKTEVIIIGTIHELHLRNKRYSPEVLKEILLELKPDAVLNELPLSQVQDDGRPVFRDRNHPEGWASDQVAQQLGIKQIPFDRPDRQENFKRTRYFERKKRYDELFEKWVKQLEKEAPASEHLPLLRGFMKINTERDDLNRPNVLNSCAADELTRLIYCYTQEVLPKVWARFPGYEVLVEDAQFLKNQWQERNQIMADNIVEVAKDYRGKRLVALTGANHRFVLRDLLKDEETVELKEYWEVVEVDLTKVPVPECVPVEVWGRPFTEKQTKAHAQLARDYWKAVIRGDWVRVSEFRPILTPEQWVAKLGKNPPVELVEVGQPYWQEGCRTCPVTPCTLRFADGKLREVRLLTDFREIDGQQVGHIPAQWGKPREIDVD